MLVNNIQRRQTAHMLKRLQNVNYSQFIKYPSDIL
jgi:hypothetical protein